MTHLTAFQRAFSPVLHGFWDSSATRRAVIRELDRVRMLDVQEQIAARQLPNRPAGEFEDGFTYAEQREHPAAWRYE